jgi:hypothetical protein
MSTAERPLCPMLSFHKRYGRNFRFLPPMTVIKVNFVPMCLDINIVPSVSLRINSEKAPVTVQSRRMEMFSRLAVKQSRLTNERLADRPDHDRYPIPALDR